MVVKGDREEGGEGGEGGLVEASVQNASNRTPYASFPFPPFVVLPPSPRSSLLPSSPFHLLPFLLPPPPFLILSPCVFPLSHLPTLSFSTSSHAALRLSPFPLPPFLTLPRSPISGHLNRMVVADAVRKKRC